MGACWALLAPSNDRADEYTVTTPSPTPRLPIANGYQLTLNLSDGGQPAALVLGARGPVGGINATVAAAWRDAAWNEFRKMAASDVVLVGATVRDVDGSPAPPIEVGAGTTPGGTLAGTRTLAAACTLVKWQTALGGRSGRGRTFIPGLTGANVSSNGRTYAATYSDFCQANINNYRTSAALASAGIVPCILSFRRGEATPIESGALAVIVGVQRRRMRG